MSTSLSLDITALLGVLRGRGMQARAAKVLGNVHSAFDLLDVVASGLPKESLTAVVGAATRNVTEAVSARRRVIPDATWKRRTLRLSPAESDRTMRLARLVALTRRVWHNNAKDVSEFLSTPHPLLNGQTPLECSASDIGAELVEGVLLRLMYGVAG